MPKDEVIDFPRLVGMVNYVRWKREFRLIAMTKGLWTIFQATEPVVERPKLLKTAFLDSGYELKEFELRHAASEKYQTRVMQARTLLAGSINASVRSLILGGYESPSEAWTKIARYCTPHRLHQSNLLHYRRCCLKFSDAQCWINEHLQLREDFKEINATKHIEEDSVLLKRLVVGLPNEYLVVKEGYDRVMQKGRTWTLGNMHADILAFEIRLAEGTQPEVAYTSTTLSTLGTDRQN